MGARAGGSAAGEELTPPKVVASMQPQAPSAMACMEKPCTFSSTSMLMLRITPSTLSGRHILSFHLRLHVATPQVPRRVGMVWCSYVQTRMVGSLTISPRRRCTHP